jgi:hypothetical protein
VTRNGWMVRDAVLNKIALWTYYKGAMRDPGIDEGATTIAYLPGKGWFWYCLKCALMLNAVSIRTDLMSCEGTRAPRRGLIDGRTARSKAIAIPRVVPPPSPPVPGRLAAGIRKAVERLQAWWHRDIRIMRGRSWACLS